MKFDLLQAGGEGGCSAKIPAGSLTKLLAGIEMLTDKNVMVNGGSYDDAGVYRLNDETALVVTTDFFPPMCSDPYQFGQIAAANSLSDVYAMGGKPLLVLNINMFPADTIDMEVLSDILRGGQSIVNQSGAFTMGGHTINDQGVKYGLAVVGTVDPKRVISNNAAKVGDVLILTKPLGSGVAVAAQRMGMIAPAHYAAALDNMTLLNDRGAEIMQQFNVRAATDITGFGLAGHAKSMAAASNVTIELKYSALPILDGVVELLEQGCLPSTVFKNLDFVRSSTNFDDSLSFEQRAITLDAQTSGGLLMCVEAAQAERALEMLRRTYIYSAIVGRVVSRQMAQLLVIG